MKSAQAEAATARPWGIGAGSCDVPSQAVIRSESGRGWDIVHCFGVDHSEANAALIVRAVNAHDALVAALEAAGAWMAEVWPEAKDGTLLEQTRAALELARKGS